MWWPVGRKGKKWSERKGERRDERSKPNSSHVQWLLCSFYMPLLCSIPNIEKKKKQLSISSQFYGAKASNKGTYPGEGVCLFHICNKCN